MFRYNMIETIYGPQMIYKEDGKYLLVSDVIEMLENVQGGCSDRTYENVQDIIGELSV